MAEQHERRDGRATDTRRRILQVAEELYYAGGYEHINMQVIADRLGVSKTALFHHFKNKQELFYATLHVILDQYRRMMEEAAAEGDGSTIAQLRGMMQRLTRESSFDFTRFMHEEHALLTPEQQREIERLWQAGMFNAVRRVLEEGVRRGELRPIDLSLSTYAFLSLCMLLPRPNNPMPVAVVDRSRMPAAATAGQVSHDAFIDSLLDLFIHGIGGPTPS